MGVGGSDGMGVGGCDGWMLTEWVLMEVVDHDWRVGCGWM